MFSQSTAINSPEKTHTHIHESAHIHNNNIIHNTQYNVRPKPVDKYRNYSAMPGFRFPLYHYEILLSNDRALWFRPLHPSPISFCVSMFFLDLVACRFSLGLDREIYLDFCVMPPPLFVVYHRSPSVS